MIKPHARKKKLKKLSKDGIIKDEIIKDDRIFFESEKDYYEPIEIESALNNLIEYEFKDDRHKTLLLDKYLEITKPCLHNVMSLEDSFISQNYI